MRTIPHQPPLVAMLFQGFNTRNIPAFLFGKPNPENTRRSALGSRQTRCNKSDTRHGVMAHDENKEEHVSRV